MARVWFKFIYKVFLVVLTFTAILLAVENLNSYQLMRTELKNREDPEYEPNSDALEGRKVHRFHDIFYMIIVTISTVGYGDIFPYTVVGQYLVIAVMISFFTILQRELSEFSKFNSLTSEYSRHFYQKSKRDIKHILLLGESQPEAIKTFLKECFHSDHGMQEMDIVIMRTSPPSDELSQILKMPKFETRVHFLQGNPLNHDDLRRC